MKTLSVQDTRLLAASAEVDPRTVARYAAGLPVRPSSLDFHEGELA